MLRILTIIAILTITLFLIYSQRFRTKTLTIGNVTIQIEIADDLSEQTKGLSGRNLLCANCGMLFVYDRPRIQTFWMKDMKFPLDIIFIRDNQIVEIVENVPVPVDGQVIPRVTSKVESDKVLEVNAGFVKKHDLTLRGEVSY